MDFLNRCLHWMEDILLKPVRQQYKNVKRLLRYCKRKINATKNKISRYMRNRDFNEDLIKLMAITSLLAILPLKVCTIPFIVLSVDVRNFTVADLNNSGDADPIPIIARAIGSHDFKILIVQGLSSQEEHDILAASLLNPGVTLTPYDAPIDSNGLVVHTGLAVASPYHIDESAFVSDGTPDNFVQQVKVRIPYNNRSIEVVNGIDVSWMVGNDSTTAGHEEQVKKLYERFVESDEDRVIFAGSKLTNDKLNGNTEPVNETPIKRELENGEHGAVESILIFKHCLPVTMEYPFMTEQYISLSADSDKQYAVSSTGAKKTTMNYNFVTSGQAAKDFILQEDSGSCTPLPHELLSLIFKIHNFRFLLYGETQIA